VEAVHDTKSLKQGKLETIQEKGKEGNYQGGKIEDWDKEDEMGCMGDEINKL